MLIPIILSGGSGTRLWPLSREAFPKQFLSLVSEQSLLGDTLRRASLLKEVGAPMIVSNEEHRFVVAAIAQQLGYQGGVDILLEPFGRNTAPAIAIAAMQALIRYDDPILLVLPSDHVIQEGAAFAEAVAAACPLAEAGNMVTFGITPDSPQTGYGYIRKGQACEAGFDIAGFVEKPSLDKAEAYLASGEYLWNSGMFVFRAQCYLDALARYQPNMLAQCQAAFANRKNDMDFIRIDRDAFFLCPSDSIDYAVMEKVETAKVIPLSAGWSDIGSWSALWEINPRDDRGNVIKGDVIVEQVENSYIHSEGRLVAVLGLHDCIIVETDDAVLAASKDCVQDVKKLVEKVKAGKREEHRFHRKVHRPWGTYEGIAISDRFQVKRITVNPGCKLSLQKHHHRAEHWVIVRGTANVTRGDEQLLLTEDQSTYIPLGVIHRLENPGVIPLELIEVQTGSYLGEDDIVRMEDHYGRS
ncbi:Mannose-1-phosphate guanylyltransferase/mannose-6-phosphate isomerase [gamma proteobacterium HdN1]|nr:Mannose-1-phosphate guanylyltransferase/mannose-6-phosphate isomerase [gamma proteobacterium HdN1]